MACGDAHKLALRDAYTVTNGEPNGNGYAVSESNGERYGFIERAAIRDARTSVHPISVTDSDSGSNCDALADAQAYEYAVGRNADAVAYRFVDPGHHPDSITRSAAVYAAESRTGVLHARVGLGELH